MNGLVDRKANYMNRKSLDIKEVEYDAGGNIKSMLVEFVRNDQVQVEGSKLNKENLEAAVESVIQRLMNQ